MRYSALRCVRLFCWNLWSVVRLVLVLAALAVWAHWNLSVNPPSARMLGEIVACAAILTVVSGVVYLPLLRLYWALLRMPLYAVLVLHSLFYDGIRQMLRQLVGTRRPCLEAGCALAGELGFSIGVANSMTSALRTWCNF
jgi:hypothetical protein